ncbi:2-hydroxy-3-oxopropionate reductase [Haloactinopolyspora alba]|uniref:2-hydroxy-3-oxopropionate reductase n=1 Tax=Haloactinopolyspora alba TaxID=648780 RepID=A0A2P8EFP9_9ACTN|nr:2-hydroxy-3-oxopropionate reductase [Haloactinopolyspora alba]PSL08298.1 2-hydroxy-3-oxopropionate reductase [Haloactinopolyspora alba]
MTTVAVVGLGIMGAPMARNLLDAGFDVVGCNRSRAPVDAFVEAGGRGADDVASAVGTADVIITVLPDAPDVAEVTSGPDGILAHCPRGALHIDMSTIAPAAARELAEAAAEAGVRSLDAPVSGGDQGAADGTLSIMVGGEAADVEEARPLFEAMGSTIEHVGPSGAGQTLKAANQLIVGGTIQLVAEAIVMLEASGVDPEAAVPVLAGGMAGNRILDRKAEGMLKRDFTPRFRVDLHHKDLGIVLDTAREAGATIPLGAAVAQLMGAARARGDGQLDHTALLRLVEELSGRSGE